MQRSFTCILVSLILFNAGFLLNSPLATVESSVANIEKLVEERIQLLQKRIELVDLLVKADHAAIGDRIAPTIDLLEARIEYAKTSDEKKALYDELLEQHDLAIQIAVHSETEPNPGTNSRWPSESRNDLLFLKSERIKIQIKRESLN